jgi:hypothetical protein
MLDRANSFNLDIREHEQLLAVERRILAVLAAVGPVDAVEDEGGEEGGGEDRDEGENEEENDIAEEEMGEVVMRVLVEELRDEAADVEL